MIEPDLFKYLVDTIYKDASEEVKAQKYNWFYENLNLFYKGNLPFRDLLDIITKDVPE